MSEGYFRPPNDIDPNIIDMVPTEMALEYKIIPYKIEETEEGKTLFLAVIDDKDLYSLDNIRFVVGCQIETSLVTPEWMEEALYKYYTEPPYSEIVKRIKKLEEDVAMLVVNSKQEKI